MTVIVGTAPGAGDLIDPVRRAIWSIDPDLPVPDVRPVADRRAAAMAEPRFGTILVAGFAALALVLTAIGLYGVLAFAVVRRTREIGVRVALGAQPAEVMTLVVRWGVLITAIGMTAGLAAALALTRFMKGVLFDTSPTDPATFAAVVAVFGLVALAATWVPARRAMAVDPMEALRGGD